MCGGLGERQQNCGDSGMIQAVGTAFAKPWRERRVLGFTEVHVGRDEASELYLGFSMEPRKDFQQGSNTI